MDTLYSPQSRAERFIATGRVVLATSALFAVWLDPTEPAKFARFAYSLLAAYVVYSTFIALLEHAAGVLGAPHAVLAWVESEEPWLYLASWRQGEFGIPTKVVLLTAALNDDQLVEAVRLGVRGVVLKETAPCLFITEGTVKIHFHNVYQKLKITGRLELALYARDKGLV